MNPVQPTTCIEAEPFALQIRDDSMTPEFWSGCVILIDPTGRVTDGAFVLAEVENQYLCRKFVDCDGTLSLQALNPDFETFEIDSTSDVLGVVVQRSGVRRRQHKNYYS